MPSDSNGVFSLVTGYLAETGETIQPSQHNPPLEDIAAAITARLMRSGAAPMTGPLKIVDGSVGAPAVQLSNAPTTGFYKTANGIGVAVNGTGVAEFGPGGMVSGARWVGELIKFTGSTAPALTVLPYGQTLSRATYADLWAFAQTEIAAGNPFYNNGNGSTTFGIGDLRGRVVAGPDNMGGTAANVLPGWTQGHAAGTWFNTIVTSNLPPYTPSGGVTGTFSGSGTASNGQFTGGNGAGPSTVPSIFNGAATALGLTVTIPSQPISAGFTGTAQGGTSSPLSIVQPTIALNYLLFAGA